MKNPPKTKVGDVRAPWLICVLGGLAILVCAAVLYLTRHRNFFYDEWVFIVDRRGWSLDVFLIPHSAHWSALWVLVWKITFAIVGMRSHLPYEAVLLVVHAITVLLIFTLIRRRSGDLPAFAGAATLLLLGTGEDDINWAFQVAWVASIGFGLVAMLLVEGNPSFTARRAAAVTAAVLCSLMFSSVGLAFMVALGAWLAVDRDCRQYLLALVLPAGAFVGWFLKYDTGPDPGGAGVAVTLLKGPTGLTYATSLARFVVRGLQATTSGVVGMNDVGPISIIALFAVLAWVAYRRRGLPSWQFGLLAGLVFWFLLIGLGRVQTGIAQADQSRFVYVGVALLLPVVADMIRDLPWRGLWRPAFLAFFAFILWGNVTLLFAGSMRLDVFMEYEDAELQTIETFRDAPDLNPAAYIDGTVISQVRVRDYLAATASYGSPVPPTSVDSLRQLPWVYVDRVMDNVFGSALSVKADSLRSTQGLTCQTIDSSKGTALYLQMPNGGTLMLESTKDVQASLFLSFLNPPPPDATTQATLVAGTPEWVHIPDTGKPIVWQLRIQFNPATAIKECSTSHYQISEVGTYRAEAAAFTLGHGWSVVADGNALTGTAARAAAGTPTLSGGFSASFVPTPGQYDIWYRVRVASVRSHKAEMVLTLTDVTRNEYVIAHEFRPSDVSTTYAWALVAPSVRPTPGDWLRFQVNNGPGLSTDWFIDTALMLPAGSPIPGA